MSLAAGTRLGSYEVAAQIGAGGMGEVYRAHDTKLSRDVAIKVLPQAFANDPERLSRFQREAKMLASLNHPNIATIYGLEQSGGTSYLVMELVPGETLQERVKRDGAIPVEEALEIAKQIAEALEAAHEKQIIHRDLKPANVKVTPEGKVKVLDFGLAKAFADDSATGDLSNSPTLSRAATMQGVILGTAAYMSPEQARGKVVDKRTDIWAFGCVLFEQLTGKQAFDGEDITDILAAVVRAEPDWQALPAATPLKVRDLLRRCLQKDKTLRLRDAGDARIEIHEALTTPFRVEPLAVQSKNLFSNIRAAWSVAAISIVIATLGWGAFAYLRHAPEVAQQVRFFVSLPDGWVLEQSVGAGGAATIPLAASPDGHRVAFVASARDGKSLLWVRSLDALTAQALAGTEGAARPFWSPDSRFLGFFAGGKLKKIELSSGPPITLCDAPDDRGGTWSQEGVIVFAPQANSALQKVSASGGVPNAATVLTEGETAHRRPYFLPDGRHFLYRSVTSSGVGGPIYVASLDSAERKLILNADSANVAYSRGHLLFLRETTLMAQPFDTQRLALTGEAFPIAEEILRSVTTPPYGFFSASENGLLAYQTGSASAGYQLLWLDRTGKQLGALGDQALYGDLELSPDGKRTSVATVDQVGQVRDIWLYDVGRGLRTRFTFGPGAAFTSIWSPDGSRIVFSAFRKGHLDLYQKSSSGAGAEEVLLEDNHDKIPVSWSPDGRFILFRTVGTAARELFILPLSGDRKPVPFLNTKFNENFGRFSPDGRWIAYSSDESGRSEVYVAPFPGPGGKWQISTAGGEFPRWQHDGTEIFYLSPENRLMAATVNGKGANFEVGAVKSLFAPRIATGGRYQYDVSPDGQRFLINTALDQATSAPITVVVNWTAGLKK
jgi:Tol biopolymer transport system component